MLRLPFALAWTLLLTILLLQGEADPLINLGLPSGANTLARELAFSAVHLLAFGFTCLCWHWALSASAAAERSALAAITIAITLGASTEFLQTATLDRHFSWLDLGANFAGVLIAAALLEWRLRALPPATPADSAGSPRR